MHDYDPESMGQAEPLLPGMTFAVNAYDCVDGADAVAILTQWDSSAPSTWRGSRHS